VKNHILSPSIGSVLSCGYPLRLDVATQNPKLKCGDVKRALSHRTAQSSAAPAPRGTLFKLPSAPHQIPTVLYTACFTYCIPPPSLQPLRLMTSRTFWSDACSTARSRPVQALVNTAYASCGVTVRCAPAAPAPEVVCAAGCRSAVSSRPVCDALLRRLPRSARAPLRAAPCFVCGGAWARMIGGACGSCTDGSAG
jgi:hypothetical protein